VVARFASTGTTAVAWLGGSGEEGGGGAYKFGIAREGEGGGEGGRGGGEGGGGGVDIYHISATSSYSYASSKPQRYTFSDVVFSWLYVSSSRLCVSSRVSAKCCRCYILKKKKSSLMVPIGL
jgi:hypothetical protein